MTAPETTDAGARNAKLIIRGALLEVPCILAGVAAWLYTGAIQWLFVGVAVGAALLFWVAIIPIIKSKVAPEKSGSIVE